MSSPAVPSRHAPGSESWSLESRWRSHTTARSRQNGGGGNPDPPPRRATGGPKSRAGTTSRSPAWQVEGSVAREPPTGGEATGSFEGPGPALSSSDGPSCPGEQEATEGHRTASDAPARSAAGVLASGAGGEIGRAHV